MAIHRTIRGDESRFTWDDPGMLSFAQCGTCENKSANTLGCTAFPENIPMKYKLPGDIEDCPYYEGIKGEQ